MGRAAKRRQARKKFKSGRKPTPDSTVLESKLNSAELKDWLIHEWNYLADFYLLVTPQQKNELAKAMLARLHELLASDYDRDPRVKYNLNSHLFVAAGINVYNWTVWGAAGDRLTGFNYATPDDKEYKLS